MSRLYLVVSGQSRLADFSWQVGLPAQVKRVKKYPSSAEGGLPEPPRRAGPPEAKITLFGFILCEKSGKEKLNKDGLDAFSKKRRSGTLVNEEHGRWPHS